MAQAPLPGLRIWVRILGYSIAALIGALIHVLVLPVIALSGVVPDVLLVLVFWVALRHGQVAGTVAGFAIGLLLDVVMQGGLGVHAFAKTLAGFVVGFFARLDDPEWLRSVELWRVMGIVALGTTVHAVVYHALLLHPLDAPSFLFVLAYAGAAVVYTLIVAMGLLLGWRLLGRRGLTSARSRFPPVG